MAKKVKQQLKKILHKGPEDLIKNVFTESNIDVASIMLESIEFAIEHELDVAPLFELCFTKDGKTAYDDMPVQFYCINSEWKDGLKYLNNIFLTQEQYEYCGKVNTLLSKLENK
jgi:hypothetical protein